MIGMFEVWVRGRRAITCDTRQEADHLRANIPVCGCGPT